MSAPRVMTDEEMDAHLGNATGPREMTDEEMDQHLAGGAGGDAAAPNPVKVSLVPKSEPGFITRALTQIGEGVGNIGHVAKDQGRLLGDIVRHPIDTARRQWSPEGLQKSAAERHELERGVSDTLLGLPEKGAEAVQNMSAFAFPEHVQPYATDEQQAHEAQLAPGVRTVGRGSGLLLANPVGGATEAAGNVAKEVAPGAASSIARVLGKVPTPLRSVGAYEGTAPLAAAATAPEGHRLEAAGQAATDPTGIMIATALGALHPARNAVLGSEGAKAREYIEQHGQGASVGPFQAGNGGVYDSRLAGLPDTDASIGRAGMRGAKGIMNTLESGAEQKQGYPYRGGPQLVKDAQTALTDTNAQGRVDLALAREQRRTDLKAAKNEVIAETSKRSNKLVGDLEESRRETASEPYRQAKEQVMASPEGTQKQDATELVKRMREAVKDLRTPLDVRGKLQADLALLEQYSDAPPPAEVPPPSPKLPALLKARETAKGATADRLDQMIAAEMAPPAPAGPKHQVRYMVPADQLNGFRGSLMEQAQIGQSDAPRAHEEPLRGAAFEAKRLVDEGPFADPNAQFHAAASANEQARQAIGLKKRSQRDRAAEVEGLTKRLRKGINDPTQIPGKNVPPEADLSDLRQKVATAEASAQPTVDRTRADTQAARAAVNDAKTRRQAGDEAASPDRRMLGLNEKIGTRKADVNQLRLVLGRQAQNTETAGATEEGPYKTNENLPAFREKYPGLDTDTRLAELMRKRLDLKFTLGAPAHGGIHRINSGQLVRTLKANVAPIAGRVAYGPAKLFDPVSIARALGIGRGTTLGEKIKAAQEAEKERQQ